MNLHPNFEPLEAYNEEYNFPTDVELPCIVSPKYDGIRVMQLGDKWLTKKFKPIQSEQAKEFLATRASGLRFIDAELLVVDGDYNYLSFNDIQSRVMSKRDGRLKKGESFRLKVFDSFADHKEPYTFRMLMLSSQIDDQCEDVRLVPTWECDTVEGLVTWCELFSTRYEGAIIRKPDGRYKFGRSTLKEQLVLKYVKLVREEGIITGATENDIHPDRIGALLVHTDKWGTIKVGSGFDHKLSREFKQGQHMQRMITYQYKPHGMKAMPRQPTFVGFREDI